MRDYESPPVGRPPKSRSKAVSRSMKSNRSSRTGPELVLAKLLRKPIVKSDLPGSPDFVYPNKKVAIFVHGCFWHRCPTCDFDLPKRNRGFWKRKFERNVERDRLVREELEGTGWKVLEVWEHQIKEDPKKVSRAILKFLHDSNSAEKSHRQ